MKLKHLSEWPRHWAIDPKFMRLNPSTTSKVYKMMQWCMNPIHFSCAFSKFIFFIFFIITISLT